MAVSARPNAVHLDDFSALPRQVQEALGENDCVPANWQPNHRPHQSPWCCQVFRRSKGPQDPAGHQSDQHPRARSACTGGRLFRHRLGALFAVVLPESTALFARGCAVAPGPVRKRLRWRAGRAFCEPVEAPAPLPRSVSWPCSRMALPCCNLPVCTLTAPMNGSWPKESCPPPALWGSKRMLCLPDREP